MKNIARIIILAVFLALLFFVPKERSRGLEREGAESLYRVVRLDEERGLASKDSATALRILKQKCGSCHQSTLKTAKPKALEIFDLDKTRWHESVEVKHFSGISRRIGSSKGISDADRKATLDFIDCVSRAKKSGFPTVC